MALNDYENEKLEELALQGDEEAARELERRYLQENEDSVGTITESSMRELSMGSDKKAEMNTAVKEKLDDLRSQPLLTIMQKSEEGDALAKFVLGEKLFHSTSQAEIESGIRKMNDAISDIQRHISSDPTETDNLKSVLEACAKYFVDFSMQGNTQYDEDAFRTASNLYELDRTKYKSLADCYENGIGCTQNNNKAIQLKEENAANGSYLEKLDMFVAATNNGESIKAALWAQRALADPNITNYPKSSARIRMWLGEHGLGDIDGKAIDYELAKKSYGQIESNNIEEEEAFYLFKLADSAEEKKTLASHICSDKYKTADVLSALKDEKKNPQESASTNGTKKSPSTSRKESASDTVDKSAATKKGVVNISSVADVTRPQLRGSIIGNIIKIDALIVVLSALAYALSARTIAMAVGIAALLVIDLLMLSKSRSHKDANKISTGKYIVLCLLSIVLVGTGSFFLSPANAAVRAIQSEDYSTAEAVINKSVSGNNLQEMILDKKLGSYVAHIEDAYKAGELSDDDVKSKLSPIGDILTSTLGEHINAYVSSIDAYKQGKVFFEKKNYVEAISMLSKVIKDHPRFTESQEMIEKSKDTYKGELFSKVGQPGNVEECVDALQLLNEATKALPDDQDIMNKQDEVKTAYITLLDKAVTGAIEKFDYDLAVGLLSTAKTLVGDNEEISRLQTEVQNHKPTALSSYHVINSEELWTPDRYTFDSIDTFGNEYNKENTYMLNSDAFHSEDAYASFNTGDGNKRLKGVIACQDEHTGSEFSGTVIIETSEEHSYTLTRDSKPVEIDLPLVGSDKVVIKVINKNKNEFSSDGGILIGNFFVYK